MFKGLKRISYPVSNLTGAKEWYCSILNSEPLFDSPFLTLFQIDDSFLSLIPNDQNETNSASKSIAYWEVDSIDAALEIFIKRGAILVNPAKTVMNIRIASVRDPFGNTLGLTSPEHQSERSIENRDSATAQFVGFCRALATYDPRDEMRGNDTLAELFLSQQFKVALKSEESRNWSKEKIGALYGYVLARTKVVDQIFCSAPDRFEQIVLLGAGYDSRSIRFHAMTQSMKLFEVDTLQTQKRKRTILAEKNITIPDNLNFVPVNFSVDSLEAELVAHGFTRTKTFFIWEGVVPYLIEVDFMKTLSTIAALSGSGSSLFFDYLTEQRDSQHDAEPFRLWMNSEQVEMILAENGFAVNLHLHHSDIVPQLLTMPSGEITEESVPAFAFVLGSVQ